MSGGNHCLENSPKPEYVALLPAAGIGSRLPGRLLSKELLRFGETDQGGSPVISHVLRCMQRASIDNVIVVLRRGKEDIYDYLTSSEWKQINFTFKITRGTSGVPETIAVGLDKAQGRRIVFGFPDILFEPRDAFVNLIQRLENTNADVVLGLFPTDHPSKMDMVETDDGGRVISIDIKPESTTISRSWILAVWEPSFSTYLSNMVHNDPARIAELATNSEGSHLGHIFQLALADGLLIESESFENGRLLDIGTPDDLNLARAWSNRDD